MRGFLETYMPGGVAPQLGAPGDIPEAHVGRSLCPELLRSKGNRRPQAVHPALSRPATWVKSPQEGKERMPTADESRPQACGYSPEAARDSPTP